MMKDELPKKYRANRRSLSRYASRVGGDEAF
jgi:hypothetical protein